MTNGFDLQKWISKEIEDSGTSWSIGAFGAIAEFSRDSDEPAKLVCDASRAEIVTPRGGVRIDGLNHVRPVAYETASRNPELWNHAVALCLPSADCAMNGRSVLTEIGPDESALRPENRGAVLFDLGLGTLQIDVCVRASDAEFLSVLRASAGTSVFAHGNPSMAAIVRSSPHRVFVSHVGRAEVYQGIPAPDAKSPDGAHTHVLPKLLRAGRTHSANDPIPEGWIPCAHLYPLHPGKDVFGRQKPFDRGDHDRFLGLLRAFGDPELVELKALTTESVAAGRDPAMVEAPSRFARAALRVALRQMQALDGPSPSLQMWRQAFDRAADKSVVGDDEETMHG
jgi:hypothetical protein